MLLPFLLLYVANIICYELGQKLCFALYCRFCMWTTVEYALLLLSGIALTIVLCGLYLLICHKLIRPLNKKHIAIMCLLILTVVPLSLISIHIYTGFGSQVGWVDAVKMGYPVFWTTFMFGISGYYLSNNKNTIA